MIVIYFGGGSIIELSDSRIVIGGGFTQFNGNDVTSLIILNPDGTLDTSFDASQTFSGAQHIRTVDVDDNEDYLYVGGVLNLNDVGSINGFVKINLKTTASPEPESAGSGGVNTEVNASCFVSDTTVKVGEKVDIDIDVEITDKGKDVDYSFSWSKVLTGTDQSISVSFNTPGEYTPKAKIKTNYMDKTITCDTVTVSDSNSKSSSKAGDKGDDTDTDNNTTSSMQDIVSQYRDVLLRLKLSGFIFSPEVEELLSLSSNKNTFTKDLEFGNEDSEVKLLQQFLNNHGYTVAVSGPGSPGNETNIFGPATQSALIRFQQANSIIPAQGYFGSITRSVINNF